MDAELNGWQLRGDVDLVRLNRMPEGPLQILIGDMKSTVEAKVEHRLQVAFYRLMLEQILKDAALPHEPTRTGILFRPPPDPTPEDEEAIKPLHEAAKHTFGLDAYLLEVVADPDAYARSAHDLVLGDGSTARRVAGTPFEDVPYALSFKCDDCLYNEYCMKWSAEKYDLSLLPYATGTDKDALRRAGVTTIKALASIKAVQTLSLLNRAHPQKHDVVVLNCLNNSATTLLGEPVTARTSGGRRGRGSSLRRVRPVCHRGTSGQTRFPQSCRRC